MVVVGIDGSDAAVNAARWAGRLAGRFGGSLHLVHAIRGVEETLLEITAPVQADAGAYPRKLGQAVLDRAAEAVRDDIPGMRISQTLSHQTPEAALTQLSRHARLVVLACADVSPGGALLVGSTALSVAGHSACPVVAWRGNAQAPTAQPIVVGVDENERSHAALATACELAELFGVEVKAVHAMSTRRAAGEIDNAILIDWEALKHDTWQRISALVAPISEHWPGVEITCHVEIGQASRVILSHAAGAQFVVIGSRGRGRVASALLGSTGLALLHHSPVPVVTCPASRVWPDDAPAANQAHESTGIAPRC